MWYVPLGRLVRVRTPVDELMETLGACEGDTETMLKTVPRMMDPPDGGGDWVVPCVETLRVLERLYLRPRLKEESLQGTLVPMRVHSGSPLWNPISRVAVASDQEELVTAYDCVTIAYE
jgi:hypothetical protein